MDAPSKLAFFMTLRANGWSLNKIAEKIKIPKSTLWKWQAEHRDHIRLLRRVQLEGVHEQHLPGYKKELKSLSTQLDRINEALAAQDFSKVPPPALMQMSLQIRDRLSKMQQAASRTVPRRPMPVTGSVTKDHGCHSVEGDAAIAATGDTTDTSESKPIYVYTPFARRSSTRSHPDSTIEGNASGQN
jgi:hypothetical protein